MFLNNEFFLLETGVGAEAELKNDAEGGAVPGCNPRPSFHSSTTRGNTVKVCFLDLFFFHEIIYQISRAPPPLRLLKRYSYPQTSERPFCLHN